MDAKALTPNEYLFIRWMSENHPELLTAAEDQVKRGGALGSLTASLSNILNAVTSGLKTYVQGQQQVALVQQNVERATQGLPPVTATGAPYTVPPAQVAARTLPNDLTVPLLIGSGLLLLFFLLRK